MEKQTPDFAEFPPVTKAEWLTKISEDLKGKAIEDLNWYLGNLEVSPFHHAGDLAELPNSPGGSAGWEIGEDMDAADILAANEQALHALKNGVEAPRFLLDEILGDHRMAALLEGLDLSIVSTHFLERNKNANPLQLLHHYAHVANERGLVPRQLRGSVNWLHDEAVVQDSALELVEFAVEKLPAFKVLPVNAGRYYGGEAGVVNELAATIADGEEWLAQLSEKGIYADTTNHHLFFSIAVGKNYFVEIAKIRALKLLWAHILKGWNCEFVVPHIEACFAPTEQSDDPPANMIQATTQAMSAVTGGVDRLTVLPPDGAPGKAGFSRRIARNVQHILKMESYLDRVADPAAGSYFIEDLTNRLAAAAWAAFQKKA
jgi:methylmalonyl-CoA mutase